jgi:hypothetical protein
LPPGRSAWQTLAPLIDLVTPMAVRVAATLRLADLMDDRTVGVAELAEQSDSDPDALARLLRHLVAHGMFVEPSPGEFGLNDIAVLLLSTHPAGMREALDLEGFGGRMDVAFTGLLHTVRTGQPAWQTVFGDPFWQYLDANPTIAESFDAMMAASPEFLADAAGGYDWAKQSHVVDVGGGTGALLAEILQTGPHLRGTLVDLPETITRAREVMSARGIAERCEFVGQSFFDALPAGGDTYVLGRVVHDWDDEQATVILRRCAEAAGAHGRVVIIETHGGAGDDPAAFAEMSLRMLVIAGGRERSVSDYRNLAAAAGLRVENVHSTPLGHVIFDCVQGRG